MNREEKAGARLLRPEDLRRFENFHFAARVVVEGFYAGRHRSPFHDAAAEFADYRPYVPGDEIRALDWRAYARTDRDYVKLFRKETDMRCHLLLDVSRSMAFSGEDAAADPPRRRWWQRPNTQHPTPNTLSRFEYAAYLAAALCWLIIRQGDKASLALGASELRTFVPPGGTITHLHRLLLTLEQTRPSGPTRISAVLHSLFALARRRGLLIVLSDFLEAPGPLFAELSRYAHSGWQVMLFHILTEAELELPGGDGTVRYLDAESHAFAEAHPNALRPAYKAALRDWLDTLETQAKARRIQYARLTTATPYDRALERYLTVRARAR
jgi:uncharacterized protein (DUF58 family)